MFVVRLSLFVVCCLLNVVAVVGGLWFVSVACELLFVALTRVYIDVFFVEHLLLLFVLCLQCGVRCLLSSVCSMWTLCLLYGCLLFVVCCRFHDVDLLVFVLFFFYICLCFCLRVVV